MHIHRNILLNILIGFPVLYVDHLLMIFYPFSEISVNFFYYD